MVTRLLKASSKVSVRARGRHVLAGLTGNRATAVTLMEIYGDALCAAGEIIAGRRGGTPPGAAASSAADDRTHIYLPPEAPGLGLSVDPEAAPSEGRTDVSGNSRPQALGGTSPGEHFCFSVDAFLVAAPARRG